MHYPTDALERYPVGTLADPEANAPIYHRDLPHYSGAVVLEAELKGASPEQQQTLNAIEQMGVTVHRDFGDELYYEAADPGYRRFFTRDSIKTGLLAGVDGILASQIAFAAHYMGRMRNPRTGEEPGKPPHEWPAIGEIVTPFRDGRFTTYNSCDGAAVFLQGIAAMAEHGQPAVTEQYAGEISSAAAYIRRHVNREGLFIEDPRFAGDVGLSGRDRKFALKVTNWKDSELNRPGRREPNYPIVYTIAHFQNAQALQRIGYATGDERLARMGRYMTEQGIAHLWREDHFVSAVDGDGEVDPPSTDSLESLLYIPPTQLPEGYAERIEQYMRQLETEAGYRAGKPVVPDVDMYHMKVWVHSQAELHAAARLHGLKDAESVTERVRTFIDRDSGDYPELVDPNTYDLCGNLRQLWVMGADLYFLSPNTSYITWSPPDTFQARPSAPLFRRIIAER